MDVLEILDRISQTVSNERQFKDINSGGCAYFAVFIKYHLDYIGIDNELVYVDDRESDTPEEIINRIKDRGSRGSAAHVALKIGDKYFDSNGLHDDESPFIYEYGDHRNVIPFDMSAKEYYKHAIVKKREDWSIWYSYEKHNPKLKEIINLNFETWYKFRNLEATKVAQVQKELLSLV